jgi:AbiV family abortive infection protein
MSANTGRQIDEKTVQAMQACIDHARALLDSARAVRAAGHPNIAYHLATLVLEEIGRRELIAVQSLASQSPVPPAWPQRHTEDHTKKLFWCFFGGSFVHEEVSGKRLEEFSALAESIHATRLAGLYVDSAGDILRIPQQAMTPAECDNLIDLATARLGMAESEKRRTHITDDEVELQTWFLTVAEDTEKARLIFSKGSMSKLGELKDAKAWALWLKNQFDTADAAARAAVEEELKRSRDLPGRGTKAKWKIRVRILSASHSIRPKALAAWNKQVEWIKLVALGKKELIFELILKDNVSVEGLWWFGWGLARHFVVALNIGTMGFWWWRLPEQISRYYESIEDLEKKGMKTFVERSPALTIDWGANRVLTAEDLQRVAACMAALPGPHQRDRHKAYNHYIGGLTFLSLNDIHWQCESNVFGNFLECLKAMMEDAGDWKPETSVKDAVLKFLDEMFPGMEERSRIAELCARFEAKNFEGLVVTLSDATSMKLFCDAYFLRTAKQKNMERQTGAAAAAGPSGAA